MPNPLAGLSLDEQAKYANENINSNFGEAAWKAIGPMDGGCPPDFPYRSKRAGGDNACVEHPDNCPHGKTLHGTSCIPWEQANQMFGGGYGDSAPAAPQAPMAAPNPLQGLMTGMPQTGQPQTGTPWGEKPLGLPQMLQPYQGQTSATQGLLAGVMAPKQASPNNQMGLGTGWTSGQDGLTQMMARNQRKRGQVGNGMGGNWWV